jgi:hypothetical protein
MKSGVDFLSNLWRHLASERWGDESHPMFKSFDKDFSLMGDKIHELKVVAKNYVAPMDTEAFMKVLNLSVEIQKIQDDMVVKYFPLVFEEGEGGT